MNVTGSRPRRLLVRTGVTMLASLLRRGARLAARIPGVLCRIILEAPARLPSPSSLLASARGTLAGMGRTHVDDDPTAQRGSYEVRIAVERGDLYFSTEHPFDKFPGKDVLVLLKEEAVDIWDALYPDDGPPDGINVICTYYDRTGASAVLVED